MKLTHSVVLNITNKDRALLDEKSKEAARCWNDIVKLSFYAWKEYGLWLSNYDIQPFLQRKYKLAANTVNGLTDKFYSIKTTTATCRKMGLNNKYPYKTKKFFCLPLKKSNFKRIDNILRITLAKGEYLYIPFPNDLIKEPSYGEITYKKNKYVFYYIVDIEEEKEVISDTKLGIDLGEIHSISAVTNTGNALIVTNRLGRSYKRYRNKQLAILQSKISKCKKGSNRYKKLVRAKRRLLNKTDNKLKNLYHQTTRKTIDFAKKHNVSEIICGNCKGLAMNTKKKKRLNRGNRQKMSQMEYGTLMNQLKYKAALNGIRFILVSEAYTSQTCPKCGHLHKINNRNYKCCDCGYTAHRDIVGAWNILNKKYTFEIPDFNIIGIYPVKSIS